MIRTTSYHTPVVLESIGKSTIGFVLRDFSFVIPKDIAYNYGNGKISYYAVSDEDSPIDAGGSEESFIIGGTAEDIDYDYDGAIIVLSGDTGWSWKDYFLSKEFKDDMKKIYPDVQIMSEEEFCTKYSK